MKILAFAGSSSSLSINKKLVCYAASLFKNSEVEVLDLRDYEMPVFNVDLEKEVGQQPLAKAFLDKIAAADFLIISLAEHNGNFTASFKNIFDWASRINKEVFQQKPMLLMATSRGGRGGATVLELAKSSFPRFATDIKATFTLPNFNANFDVEKGIISNVDLDQELKQIISQL